MRELPVLKHALLLIVGFLADCVTSISRFHRLSTVLLLMPLILVEDNSVGRWADVERVSHSPQIGHPVYSTGQRPLFILALQVTALVLEIDKLLGGQEL